jgi:hypothetical protein
MFLLHPASKGKFSIVNKQYKKLISTIEHILSKLISDKDGSDNLIKFLSMRKQYHNTILMYCIIIIKIKKLLKQVKHEKLINVVIN